MYLWPARSSCTTLLRVGVGAEDTLALPAAICGKARASTRIEWGGLALRPDRRWGRQELRIAPRINSHQNNENDNGRK